MADASQKLCTWSFFHFTPFVEQFEQTLGCCQAILDSCTGTSEMFERFVQQQDCRQKGNKLTLGTFTSDDTVPTIPHHCGNPTGGNQLNHRRNKRTYAAGFH